MKTLTAPLFLAAALFAQGIASNRAAAADGDGEAEADGWKDLIAEGMPGWSNPYEWGEVSVADGIVSLKADKKFFLVTEEFYGDFEFEGEIKLPEGQANSGFMFRCHVEKNRVFGYQAEVDGSDRRWSGGLYDEGRRQWIWPPKSGRTKDEAILAREAEGQAHFAKAEVRGALDRTGWNRYRIVCRGDHLQIWVNGVQTTDLHDDVDAEGPLGIQHHGEKGQVYQFRNLRVRPLK